MKYIKVLGNVVTGIAIILIFYKLFTMEIDTSGLFTQRAISILIAVLLLYTATVLCTPWPWMQLISVTEEKNLSYPNVCMYYTKSNLMKYLPGNVFQYVGRNQVAQVYHLDHGNVALASLLEIILVILASLILSMVFGGTKALSLISFENLKFLLLVGIVGIVLLSIVGIVAYQKGAWGKIQCYITLKIQSLKSWRAVRKFAIALLFYLVSNLLQAINFCMVLSIFLPNIFSTSNLFLLIGAYVFAWLLGYITPGSPGGLGVREVTMMAMLSQTTVGLDEITISLALIRGINILGDLGAFLCSALYVRTQRKL